MSVGVFCVAVLIGGPMPIAQAHPEIVAQADLGEGGAAPTWPRRGAEPGTIPLPPGLADAGRDRSGGGQRPHEPGAVPLPPGVDEPGVPDIGDLAKPDLEALERARRRREAQRKERNLYVLFFIAVLGLVGGGLFLRWYYSDEQRTKRALREAREKPIGDVGERELAKIVGALHAGDELLEAPLSGRSCAGYHVIVEELRSYGQSSSWHAIVDESECVPFEVHDDTGVAVVRPVEPKLALVRDAHFESGTFNDASAELEAFLRERDESSTGSLLGLNRSLRYREGALEPGETVAVRGRGRWEPDPDPARQTAGGYRKRVERLVVEEVGAEDEQALLISDDPSVLS